MRKLLLLLVSLSLIASVLLLGPAVGNAFIGSNELQQLCQDIVNKGVRTDDPQAIFEAININGNPELRFYATLLFKLTDRGYIPVMLTVIEEQWKTIGDRIEISQWIVTDIGIDGAPEAGVHNILIENKSGMVLDMKTEKLSIDETGDRYEKVILMFISRVSI